MLLSQLANLQWARCRGLLRSATHVVFQASNMWWWRSGMEAAVEARNSSVPRVTSAEACSAYEHMQARNKDGTHQICYPVGSRGSMRNREGLIRDKCHVPPFAGLSFTVATKHEGSFYSMQDVRRISDLGAGSAPREAYQRARRVVRWDELLGKCLRLRLRRTAPLDDERSLLGD